MRRPGLLLLVAALACGTTSGQRAAQSPKPVADRTEALEDPLLSCVDAVNHNAKLGVSVKGKPGTPRLLVTEVRLAAWTGAGAGGMKPPEDRAVVESQNQTLMDAAARALQTVRAECAPNAPGEPVCVRSGPGQYPYGRCTLGTG